ncbi:hypothetical protein ACFL2E_09090 [Thermodesulfobacteriota bacterium]
MVKEKLETKARKALLRIEKKVADINYVLRDLSMKLCHMITSMRDYYKGTDKNPYFNGS